ncbi:hypothetical protein OHT59_29740 [Streptomyces sp. NBC_00243]|uniref:hypothetical protein n=1 Tax=Streptomyces sp. NBC_00243 TaxID=2975688 RepID=UPI002DDA5D41|nr:hypothetical protein [Streptomyces sp. NBC_00243]WRZ22367.1 hypothetical protein OHT59_29740 [Streptomyces sp. NBC_00243]
MKARQFITASVLLAVAATATACGGKSEESDGWQSKQDVVAEVKNLRKGTDLPPGGKWTAEVSGAEGDRYQTGSADALVLDEAQCEWYAYWLDRTEASDKKAVASAQKQFAVLHDMAAYKANDVSYRKLVQSVEDAAELGDPSGIQGFVRDNCGGMQEGSNYQ